MSQYLITYDLHNRRDYRSLYQLLAFWNATRLTESNWLVNLLGPAPVIRDIVASHLDGDDTIAVVEVEKGADWATIRVKPTANAWLSANVMPSQMAA
ncbi:MAG: hypothetical protein H7232_18085 [Aeromicrobium sp.]|nr:hypothetical protein [Burkholderiales bacterium]